MKIEKCMKALGDALSEPGNEKKVSRLLRLVGYALAVESQSNLKVRNQMHEAIRVSALTSAHLAHHGYVHELAPHLHVMSVVMDGFRARVVPLNPKSLIETLLDVRTGTGSPNALFILVGHSLAHITEIDHLYALATMRTTLAVNANALAHGDARKKYLSVQIRSLLEVVNAFEALSKTKYCEWCQLRMQSYWLINMKPLKDGAAERARLWYPAKICGRCKNNSVLMDKFYTEDANPRSFP